ncbi:MAG: oligosaccharide flippase family protein [Quadrisphaera sp.]
MTDAPHVDRVTNRRSIKRFLSTASIRFLVGYPATLIYLPFLLAFVPLDAYGVWTTCAGIIAIASLADGGLQTKVTRDVAGFVARREFKQANEHLTKAILLIGAIVALITISGSSLAPAIAQYIFPAISGESAGDAVTVLICSFWVFGASTIANLAFCPLAAIQRQDRLNIAATWGILAGLGVSIVLAVMEYGIYSMLIGSVAQVFLSIFIRLLALRKLTPWVRFRPRLASLRGAPLLLGGSMYFFVGQISDIVDFQWDKLMIARYVSASSSAQYAIGSNLSIQARTAALMPFSLLLVGMAEIGHISDEARRLYKRLVYPFFSLAVILLVGVVTFGKSFFDLYLGHSFSEAGLASSLAAAALLVNLCGVPWTMVASAVDSGRRLAIAGVANMLVNGSLSYLLVTKIGYIGPLWGSVIGNAVGTALLFLLYRGSNRKLPFLGRAWLGLVASGLLSALTFTLGAVVDFGGSWYILISSIVIFAVILIAIFGLLGLLPAWQDVKRHRETRSQLT